MQEVFEKIIDRFDELLKAFPTNSIDEFYRGNGFAYKNAIKIVQQIAEEYNNGWIPVSERLPKKRRYDNGEPIEFLVTVKGVEQPVLKIINDEDKWLDFELVYACKDYREFNVIAWQPLAEPYQPKGEKE
nr:MAG TPA: Protein of unknown function (DUF551) [Caudoviricetes sp.]